MFRDGPCDALDGELRDIFGGVRGVIKFARDLMKFDFQQRPVWETEMSIAQAVQLRVKQGTEFPRIAAEVATEVLIVGIQHASRRDEVVF